MRQVVRRELAGAQVALEDQVLAVLDVVVDGGTRQPDALRDLIDRGCGDAARVELARRLVEQHLALRGPGRRAGQLRACRARAPAAGRRLSFLLLARLGHLLCVVL